MDNITHTLLGAAFAEVALPEGARREARRVFLAAGLLSANLPDADLLYTGVTPGPLGYLLHHRGHTHTVAALLPQALVLALGLAAWPAARRVASTLRGRLAALVAAGLLSHLVLDSWNSYGVHPFHPLDSRWYYGDAVFIFEPWLWVLLAAAAAANAATRAGRVMAGLVFLLPPLLAFVGALPPGAAAATLVLALALLLLFRKCTPRRRAALALGAGSAFVCALFALSATARSRTEAAFAAVSPGRVVDVVLSPNPGLPYCWAVLVVEMDAPRDAYVVHRGTLSLLPRWRPPEECPSHRLTGLRTAALAGGGSLAWSFPDTGSLAELRRRAQRDCEVRAWLQFGRAPAVRERTLADLRFDGPRGNFTTLPLPPDGAPRSCPPHLTRWAMPRADLLAP